MPCMGPHTSRWAHAMHGATHTQVGTCHTWGHTCPGGYMPCMGPHTPRWVHAMHRATPTHTGGYMPCMGPHTPRWVHAMHGATHTQVGTCHAWGHTHPCKYHAWGHMLICPVLLSEQPIGTAVSPPVSASSPPLTHIFLNLTSSLAGSHPTTGTPSCPSCSTSASSARGWA